MRFYFLFLFAVSFNLSCAQSASDSIFVAKSFLGYKFYQKDTRLNFNQLPYIMEDNSEAYSLITKARGNNTISSILSGSGGFLIGWQLVTAIVGGDPNWTIAGIGGGLIAISIPIYSKSYKQSLKSVEMYNTGLGMNSHRLFLSIVSLQTGIGIKLGF